MKGIKGVIFVFLFLFGVACLKPYKPEIHIESEGYLVVEGVVDIFDGKGQIVLSRTKSLDAVNQNTAESGAEVWIEGENGSRLFFEEKTKGVYIGNFENYSPELQSRLTIITKDNQEYQSDYVPFKVSPEIDSLTWEANDEGLSFFVDTHDDKGETRYYRWEFLETSEYNSMFASKGIYNDSLQELVERDQDTQNIYICWKEERSRSVILSNTTHLTEDIISHKKIVTLAPDSWKHRFKYSILAKQYAITLEEYDYWQNIQQSNENVGSIFDAQPSNVGSNIRCITTPESPVFGYFSFGKSSQTREFVSAFELPTWNRGYNIPYTCEPSDEVFVPLQEFYADPYAYPIVLIVYSPSGAMIGITTADTECVDCSFAGRGSTVRPDYSE